MRVSLFIQLLRSYHAAFSTLPASISSRAPFWWFSFSKARPHSKALSESPGVFVESSQDISISKESKNVRDLENEPKGSEAARVNHGPDRRSAQKWQKSPLSNYFRRDIPQEKTEEVIREATEQLRIALQAWSVSEQAKAATTASANRQSSPPPKNPISKEKAENMPRALSINSQPPAEGQVSKTRSAVTDVSAKDIASGGKQTLETRSEQEPQTSSPPSHGWIRNKRSKFWEIVVSVPSLSVDLNSVDVNAPFSISTPMEIRTQTNRSLPVTSVTVTSDSRQEERGAWKPFIPPQEHLSEARGGLNNPVPSNLTTNPSIPSALVTSESGLSSSNVAFQGSPGVAHSAHCTQPTLPYIRNQYKKDVALRLAALLNCDPLLGHTILERLSDDNLRLLLVMGTANEYYGKDYYNIVKQVKAADKDCDSAISAKEYEEWALNSWQHRHYQPAGGTATVNRHTASARDNPESRFQVNTSTQSGDTSPASTQKAGSQSDPGYISWVLYMRLLLNASLPFMAFGTLDNTILIIASDTVENSLSETLGLTGLAAAGVGGIFSGVAGIQVHGLAERWTRVTPPMITKAQSNSRSYERSTNIGNTIGIVTGLVIGMFPLLFIRDNKGSESEDDGWLRKEEKRSQESGRRLQEEG